MSSCRSMIDLPYLMTVLLGALGMFHVLHNLFYSSPELDQLLMCFTQVHYYRHHGSSTTAFQHLYLTLINHYVRTF